MNRGTGYDAVSDGPPLLILVGWIFSKAGWLAYSVINEAGRRGKIAGLK